MREQFDYKKTRRAGLLRLASATSATEAKTTSASTIKHNVGGKEIIQVEYREENYHSQVKSANFCDIPYNVSEAEIRKSPHTLARFSNRAYGTQNKLVKLMQLQAKS